MRRLAVVPVCALLALAGCSGDTTPDDATATSDRSVAVGDPGSTEVDDPGSTEMDDPGSAEVDEGAWGVDIVADQLKIPWDLAVLPDGDLLVTERPGRISVVSDGSVSEVDTDLGDVFAKGEAGLMGIALSGDFADSGEFYVCSATTNDDVEVIAFTLSEDRASAERQGALVTGLPLASSGRHSGCRLLIGPDGMLYVGTGDSAAGTNPQDLTSLGGKVLRIDPATGKAPPDNPFADSSDKRTQLIYTYGHRNVQGLAVRSGSDDIYSVEHGPDIDDEINLLEPGGNYGWNPVGSGEYDESVPMTDTDLDGAVEALWSTGDPTFALSGAAFLEGGTWGDAEGTLAVAALKGSALYLVDLGDGGSAPVVSKLPQLDQEYGRLRSVVAGGDGVLYVTTSNGKDDKILKLTTG